MFEVVPNVGRWTRMDCRHWWESQILNTAGGTLHVEWGTPEAVSVQPYGCILDMLEVSEARTVPHTITDGTTTGTLPLSH